MSLDFSNIYDNVINTNVPINDKIVLLTAFKGHIKKELVNIKLIENYLNALFYILNRYTYVTDTVSNDAHPENNKLIIISHSTLCYLIKRVAMQSPTSFDKFTITRLLFYLLHSVPYEKKFWISSTRAVEAIFLVSPIILEDCLKKLCLNDFSIFIEKGFSDDDVASLITRNDINKNILAIGELVKINEKNNRDPLEILQNFNNIFIDILNNLNNGDNNNSSNEKGNLTIELLKDFLTKYYNANYLLEFSNQLTDANVRVKFLTNKSNDNFNYNNTSNQVNNIDHTSNNEHSTFDVQFEINQIVNNDLKLVTTSHTNNDKITPKSFHNFDQLINEMENLLVPFLEAKETEQNWKLRQTNCQKFREILHGNIPTESPVKFVSICKDLQFIECISKAVLSLRTTLALSAYQLLRDFCEILNTNLDIVIIEQIFNTLKTSLSSTKKISSQNAFYTLIILVANTAFQNKLFQSFYSLMSEKNVLPRMCSSVILRIYIIKFFSSNASITNAGYNKIESLVLYIEEWLKKGITDAQTSVRESTRVSFWYYYKCHPSFAKKLLQNSFSNQLKKAIELSIPSYLNVDYVPTSTASSISSSRRSSLAGPNTHRRFPSYAQPTHSSQHSTVRSTSETTYKEKHKNNSLVKEAQTNRTSFRNSLENAQRAELSNIRKTSAPSYLANGATSDNTKINQNINSSVDINSTIGNEETQLDITGDLTNNHSHTLLKKYMELNQKNNENSPRPGDSSLNHKMHTPSKFNNSSEELNYLAQNCKTLKEVKDMLFLLQSILVRDEDVDFNKIMVNLRWSMMKFPKEFKEFLNISKFYQSIPLQYTIDLYAINSLEANDLISKFDPNELLETISSLLNELVNYDKTKESSDNALFYMKHRQTIFNFCLVTISEIFQDTNRVKIDKLVTTNSIKKLTDICGRDFDEALYYNTLFIVYTKAKSSFVSVLKGLTLVSTKLKIFHEIEHRDPSFTIDEILANDRKHPSSTLEENTENFDPKYMEMTMVNPFGQKRNISNNSVIHHENEAYNLHENLNELNDIELGPHTRKLTDMTKVISMYQNAVTNDDMEIDSDEELNLENQQAGSNVNLSDIFRNQEKDHTVKFSTEPPRIINNSSTGSENTGKSGIENNSFLDQHLLSKDRDSITSASEYSTREITRRVDNIRIKNRSSFSNEATPNSISLGAPIDLTRPSSLLDDLLPQTLSYYILSQFINQDISDVDERFNNLNKAIHRIQSKTFALKHLDHILSLLVNHCNESIFIDWLTSDNGYLKLLNTSDLLLQSADDAQLIPENIISKSLLLTNCLLLLKSRYNIRLIETESYDNIWDSIVKLTGKLQVYQNEVYILLEETRSSFIKAGLFTNKNIIIILRALATTSITKADLIINIFLLETLATVISSNTVSIKEGQYSEIIEIMTMYFNNASTEIRFGSYKVLSSIYGNLQSMNTSKNVLEKAFANIDDHSMQLIYSMLS